MDYLRIALCPYELRTNVKVYYELSLLNFNGKNDSIQKTTHIFKRTEKRCWGWSFIKKKEVKELGYMNADEILAKAYVEIQ